MSSNSGLSAATSRLGPVALGATATLVASVTSVAITILINILIARTLGPENKGRIDLMIATGALAVTVSGFSLSSGITFTVAQGQVNHRRLTLQLMVTAVVQAMAVWLSLAFISTTLFANAFFPLEYRQWGSIAIGFLTFASLLGGYGRAIFAGLQKFVTVSILDVASRLLMAFITIGALLWFKKNTELAAMTIIIGSIASAYIAALVVMIVLRPLLVLNEFSSKLSRVWQYSLPSFAGNLVQFANYRLDVFLIAFYLGVKEVALYSVAVSIAQVLWLPSNAMQSVLFPRVSGMKNDDRRAEETAQIMRLMFGSTLLGGFGLAFTAPLIINFLFGERFAASLLPFWFLLPGYVIFCIANVLCGYLAGIGKPHLNFHAALVGLVATVLLDFALIPRLGIIGAALASSVSYSMSAGLVLYYFVRESQLPVQRLLWLTRSDTQVAFRALRGVLQQFLSRF